MRKLLGSDLVLGADTAGAEVQLPRLASDHYGRRMDVGRQAAIGMVLGMADILAENGCLTADVTLQLRDSFD
jgi:hypothetical protein